MRLTSRTPAWQRLPETTTPPPSTNGTGAPPGSIVVSPQGPGSLVKQATNMTCTRLPATNTFTYLPDACLASRYIHRQERTDRSHPHKGGIEAPERQHRHERRPPVGWREDLAQ